MKLEGKVALVTGSRELAKAVCTPHEEGADIVIDYRSHPEGPRRPGEVESTGRKGVVKGRFGCSDRRP